MIAVLGKAGCSFGPATGIRDVDIAVCCTALRGCTGCCKRGLEKGRQLDVLVRSTTPSTGTEPADVTAQLPNSRYRPGAYSDSHEPFLAPAVGLL